MFRNSDLSYDASYIINLAHMKKYTKGEGGTVMMSDGSEMDVSRRMKEAFLRRIKLT